MSRQNTQATQLAAFVSPLALKRRPLWAWAAMLLMLSGALSPAPARAAVPGMPGTPQAGTALYTEDFQNGSGVTEVETYVSDTGATYTAAPYWLLQQRCNGFILSYGDAYPGLNYCNSISTQWNYVRAMTNALGLLTGIPSTNRALSTLTTGGCNTTIQFCADSLITPNQIEFGTSGQLTLPTASRFVTFSVDQAATFCNFAHPLLRFYLRTDTGVEIPVSTSAINPCTDARAQTVTIDGISIRYGSFAANGSTLLTGTSLGIVLRNESNTSLGNDSAIDNIRVIDVSPQLDKSFSPTSVAVGGVSTLTLTITNTTELAAKNGWSFTDNLPAGLVVATPNAATTTCTAGVVAAAAGGGTITVSGNLNQGQVSCTVSVNVTSATATTYNNCPATNVTNLIGLNPPACAAVTFVQPSLAITKASNGPWTVGQVGATYTLNVTNAGTAATTGTITVRDQLPTGIGIRPATGFTAATGWTCAYSDEAAQSATTLVPNTGMLITCTSATAIAAGGSVALTIPVVVTSTSPASVTNYASIGGGGDPFNGGTVPTAGTTCTNAAHCASVTTSITASPPAPATCAAGSAVNLYAAAPFQGGFVTDNTTQTQTATLIATAGNYAIGTGASGRFVVDTNWRWTPGFPQPSSASTITLRVNGTAYAMLATQAGYAGYGTISALNGAALFGGTTTVEINRTSLENVWITLPAAVTAITSVEMVYTGGAAPADDFSFSSPALYGCPRLADLSISKTNTPIAGPNDQAADTITAGTNTTYSIVVINNGPDAVTGATIRDPATSGLTCSDPVACTGSGCPAATVPLSDLQGTGVVLGALANGGTVTFTLSCSVQ